MKPYLFLLGVLTAAVSACWADASSEPPKKKKMPHDYTTGPLPDGVVSLSSDRGRELLVDNSTIKNERILDMHVNQVDMKWCGPASLAVAVNAIGAAALRLKYTAMQASMSYEETEKEIEGLMAGAGSTGAESTGIRITEQELGNHPYIRDYFEKVKPSENGMTLAQLAHTADMLGFGTERYYAASSSPSAPAVPDGRVQEQAFTGVSSFRAFLKSHLSRPIMALIANYNMRLLGYEELRGHFSPIAAYNEAEDMVLVADVWPYTPVAWFPADKLFLAMQDEDKDAHAPRGLLQMYELV